MPSEATVVPEPGSTVPSCLGNNRPFGPRILREIGEKVREVPNLRCLGLGEQTKSSSIQALGFEAQTTVFLKKKNLHRSISYVSVTPNKELCMLWLTVCSGCRE
jgi:hypothetical protein